MLHYFVVLIFPSVSVNSVNTDHIIFRPALRSHVSIFSSALSLFFFPIRTSSIQRLTEILGSHGNTDVHVPPSIIPGSSREGVLQVKIVEDDSKKKKKKGWREVIKKKNKHINKKKIIYLLFIVIIPLIILIADIILIILIIFASLSFFLFL